jgi:hypothetical protein
VLFLVLIRFFGCLIDFISISGLEFRRLELAFNACKSYVCRLRRFDHISQFSRGILDYALFEYLKLRLACIIHKIDLVGAPSYLSSILVFGRSSRHRFIIVTRPVPLTGISGDLIVYRGIRLWNVLPSAAKSCRGMSMFRREAGQFSLYRRRSHTLSDLISIINFFCQFNRKLLIFFFLAAFRIFL